MERARYNTELCSNPGPLLNNVKPSNFWGSQQSIFRILFLFALHKSQTLQYPAWERLGVIAVLKMEIYS